MVRVIRAQHVVYGEHNLVQIAESDGVPGNVSFRYDPKVTLSAHAAYMLVLDLITILQSECGYTLRDDSTFERVLETT